MSIVKQVILDFSKLPISKEQLLVLSSIIKSGAKKTGVDKSEKSEK